MRCLKVGEDIRTEEQARYTRARDEEPDEPSRAFLAFRYDHSLRYLSMSGGNLDVLDPA